MYQVLQENPKGDDAYYRFESNVSNLMDSPTNEKKRKRSKDLSDIDRLETGLFTCKLDSDKYSNVDFTDEIKRLLPVNPVTVNEPFRFLCTSFSFYEGAMNDCVHYEIKKKHKIKLLYLVLGWMNRAGVALNLNQKLKVMPSEKSLELNQKQGQIALLIVGQRMLTIFEAFC